MKTHISQWDPGQGELRIRGYPIHDLIRHVSFTNLTYLLWKEELPDPEQAESWGEQIREQIDRTGEQLDPPDTGKQDPSHPRAMERFLEEEPASDQPDTSGLDVDRAKKTWCRAASFVMRQNEPEPGRSRTEEAGAASLPGRLLSGVRPEPLERPMVGPMERVCMVMAEHPADPSTRTVRRAISRGVGLMAALKAARDEFQEHGAGKAMMESMNGWADIEENAAPEDGMLGRYRENGHLPGFVKGAGETEDPRVTQLRDVAETLEESRGSGTEFRRCRRVEDRLLVEEGLHARAEFYLGPVFLLLGVPQSRLLPLFSVIRMVGWLAHALEQDSDSTDPEGPIQYQGPVERPVPT